MKVKIAIIIPFLVFLHPNLYSNDEDASRLKLVFAGDIMGHDSQIAAAYQNETIGYEYDSCFKYIKNFISAADIAIANLEVTLAGEPYKGYPQFSSPDALAVAIKNAGFDVLVTANNHSLDRGKKGLERTIHVLDSLEIIHTGTFVDADERSIKYPLVMEKNNIKLALLNYTYGTNGIEVRSPNVVNYIDTTIVRMDLLKAKSIEPDFILVTIHWGSEYQREENAVQRDLASFMFENGADCIIGAHPHVVQPIKKFYESDADSLNYKLVSYSLGNFISNQRKQYTDGGILFNMELEKVNGITRIAEYNYLPVWVYKPITNGKASFVLVPAYVYRGGLEGRAIDGASKAAMEVFYNDTRELLKNTEEIRIH